MPPVRPCPCGCGLLVDTGQRRPRYAPECQRRRQQEKQNRSRALAKARSDLSRSECKSLVPRQVVSPTRIAADPIHVPKRHCRVCFGMPWVRVDCCAGCGQPYAPERAVVGAIVLRSPMGLGA